MDTYNAIETDQDGIEIAKLILSICHPQYYDKKDVMVVVENDKEVYLFYQAL